MAGPRRDRGLAARCPATLTQEHHAAFEHDHRRDWAIAGRGRCDQPRDLRDVRGASSGAEPARRSGGGDGQPKRPQRGASFRELIEQRGCELVYLPSYSPDLNPIEEAFSKIKSLIRKVEARSREALLEALGAAIWAISDQDARGFFEHCGYRAMVQLF
jgi:hypothetical protein